MAQFAKYTLDEALILYQKGYLTTCGLVEMFFRINLKDDANWYRSFTAKELSGILGIAERTIYKAISKCRIDGYLFFCTEGKIKFARNESALESANYTTDSTAPNYENAEMIDESKALHNRTENCTIGQRIAQSGNFTEQSGNFTEQSCNQTAQSGGTTGLKPSSEGEWGDLPDYIQIYFKSFSNLLQARGVDFEKQKQFFEWWTKEGRKKVGFLLNDPIAYLNSQDPISSEKRLFLQLLKYEETLKVPDWIQQLLNDPKRAHLVKLD